MRKVVLIIMMLRGITIMSHGRNYGLPNPRGYETRTWYVGNMDHDTAGSMLKQFRKDGYFLIQASGDHFSISLRSVNLILHTRIVQEYETYYIESAPFESLLELVAYY